MGEYYLINICSLKFFNFTSVLYHVVFITKMGSILQTFIYFNFNLVEHTKPFLTMLVKFTGQAI